MGGRASGRAAAEGAGRAAAFAPPLRQHVAAAGGARAARRDAAPRDAAKPSLPAPLLSRRTRRRRRRGCGATRGGRNRRFPRHRQRRAALVAQLAV